MNRKWNILLTFLMLAALFLTACGGTTETASNESTEPAATDSSDAVNVSTDENTAAETSGEKVTIQLWHAYQTGSAEESTLTTLVANAQKEFPNMTIEVLQIPFDQIFNKWQTEVAAGEGPDMFVAPNDDLGNWVRGSLVLNLDSYLEGKLEGVVSVGVDGMTVDGSLYGVPESAKAVALYYNKSMVDTPPATTDELLKAIQDGQKMTFVNGAYHLFGWSGAFGGKLLDDSGTCVADQGGWAEALQYLLDLQAAGATFDADYGAAEAPFRAGETAFFVNGPWALADYKKDLGDNLGVALIPAGTAPATPLNGIDGFYINPNSANPQAAVDLALFLTGDASAQIYTDSAGHVPIRTSVDASSDPLVATFAEASAAGFPRPQSVEFANYWTPFGDMFTKVLEGQATPEEAVTAACTAMNAANGK